MKFLLALLFASCSINQPHVDLMAGVRDFDSRESWEQTDQQVAVGIQAHLAGQEGFGPEFSLIISDDTSRDDQYVNRPVNYTKSRIEELSIGMRKNFMLGDSFQVYVSGGLSATALKTKVDVTYAGEFSDRSVAYSPYAQTGLNFLFDEHYTFGIMYRRTFWGEDENIWINEPPTDSNLFMFTLGYSF